MQKRKLMLPFLEKKRSILGRNNRCFQNIESYKALHTKRP
jgi:hypothetical protein